MKQVLQRGEAAAAGATGAAGGAAVDDAVLPFVMQHTPEWMAAREGRITTGNFATVLGLWCTDAAMGALNLPKVSAKG